jgi:hypothetical protein
LYLSQVDQYQNKQCCAGNNEKILDKTDCRLSLSDTVILIENGRSEIKRGNARAALLSELTDLSKEHKIDIACINASEKSMGFRLSFFGIPEELHQRFRNVWGVNR